MKMIHEIGRAVFLTTEYRTVKAAFLTSTPEEQERRFFYALMLRSRGRKSLDLCGFQNAQKTRARKDTFSPQIRVLLRNKSTAKELISYGSFQSGTQHGIYRNEQPPLTQQGADLESKGLVVANALTSRRLGLYPCGAVPYQPGENRRYPGSGAGTGTRRVYRPFKGTRRKRTPAGCRLCDL